MIGGDRRTTPGSGRHAGGGSAGAAIHLLQPHDWWRVIAWSVAIAGAIAVPTRLVPNDWFGRMTPTRPHDYVFWLAGSIMAGAVMGLRRVGGPGDGKVFAGGTGTFLAVGCPVCNKLVVALVGVGGATGFFASLQPVIGLSSLALLAWALRFRLRALVAVECRVGPTGSG